MTYELLYLDAVVKKHIPTLSYEVRVKIKETIEKKLRANPISFGKPLKYSLKGHRRLRIGDYRVVYRIIPDEKIVLIIAIKHRKEIY